MKPLILASNSPRRKEILSKLGIPFTVVPSSYEEDMTLAMPPEELAKYLSHGKAHDVASEHPEAVVLGADTFIALENKVLGKPKNLEEARQMLASMSGKAHQVITGFTIISGSTVISEAVSTTVYFRHFSEVEIEAYIQKEDVLDRAGSYAIQELGAVLVDHIEGDFFSVVGLPLTAVALNLLKVGISWTEKSA